MSKHVTTDLLAFDMRETEKNPDALHDFLESVVETERWAAVRSLFAHLMAIVGVPVFLLGARPTIFVGGVRALILLAWVMCVGFYALATVAGTVWKRRLARYQPPSGS